MDFDQTQVINDLEEHEEEEERKEVAHLKVFSQQELKGTVFSLFKGENFVGRSEACNITIPNETLSKKHACIDVKERNLHLIYDCNSTNGTKRGKVLLSPIVRYELKHGDMLTFGVVECQYLTGWDVNMEEEDETVSESESVSVLPDVTVERNTEKHGENEDDSETDSESAFLDDYTKEEFEINVEEGNEACSETGSESILIDVNAKETLGIDEEEGNEADSDSESLLPDGPTMEELDINVDKPDETASETGSDSILLHITNSEDLDDCVEEGNEADSKSESLPPDGPTVEELDISLDKADETASESGSDSILLHITSNEDLGDCVEPSPEMSQNCKWCLSPHFMRNLLPSYLEKPLSEWHEVLLDLYYCFECVQEYHRLAEEMTEERPEFRKKFQELDVDRLTEAMLQALENAADKKLFDPSLQDVSKRLQVQLMELLRYPYLLHHDCLADLFIRGLICLNQCGCPLKLEEKLPGAYLLLVHPDLKVRAWAVRCVRGLGLINPDDYDLLTDVIGWMINVVQFNLFENVDPLSPEDTDAYLPFEFLPSHMFISLTRKEYWLGLFVLVRQMDVQTMRTCFMNSTEHATFLQTILSLMENEVEEEGAFWPMLQCFVVLLERLEYRIWQISSINFKPDYLFNFIRKHCVYTKYIQRWQDETEVFCRQDIQEIISSDFPRTDGLSPSHHFSGRFRNTALAWLYPFVQSLLDFDSSGENVSEVIRYLHNLAANSSRQNTFKQRVLFSFLNIIDHLLSKRVSLLAPTVDIWATDLVDVAVGESVDHRLVDLTKRMLQQILKDNFLGPINLSPNNKKQFVLLLVQTFENQRIPSPQVSLTPSELEVCRANNQSLFTTSCDRRGFTVKDVCRPKSFRTIAMNSDFQHENVDPAVRARGKHSRVSSSDAKCKDEHSIPIKRSKRSLPKKESAIGEENMASASEISQAIAAEEDDESTDEHWENDPKTRLTAGVKKKTLCLQKCRTTPDNPVFVISSDEEDDKMPKQQQAVFEGRLENDFGGAYSSNEKDDTFNQEDLLEMTSKPDSPARDLQLNVHSGNQEPTLEYVSFKADLSRGIYGSGEKPCFSSLKYTSGNSTLPPDAVGPNAAKLERVASQYDTVLYPEMEDIAFGVGDDLSGKLGREDDKTRCADLSQDPPVDVDATAGASRVVREGEQLRWDSSFKDCNYDGYRNLELNLHGDALSSVEEDLEDIYSTQSDMEEENSAIRRVDTGVHAVSDAESISRLHDNQLHEPAPGEAYLPGKHEKHVSFAGDTNTRRETTTSARQVAVQTATPASTAHKVMKEEEFFRTILRLNVADLVNTAGNARTDSTPQGLPSVLQPVKTCFENIEQYYDTFKPLFFVETWEKIANRWRDGKVDKKQVILDVLDGSTSNNIIPCSGFITEQQERKALFPMQRDLVVVKLIGRRGEFHPSEDVFGVVETADVRNVGVSGLRKFKLTLNIRTTSRFRPRRGDHQLVVKYVISLLTALRQWRGMIHFSKSPLARDILKPRKAEYFCAVNHQYLPLESKEGYNECQAKAIITATNAVHMAFPIPRICLLQGPPGSGKSHTIVGLIKEILNRPQEIPPPTASGPSSRQLRNKIRILLCAPSNVAIDALIGQIVAARIQLDNESRRCDRQSVFKKALSNNCGDLFLVRVGREREILPSVRKFGLDCLTQQVLEKEFPLAAAGNLGTIKNNIMMCETELNQLKELQGEKMALKRKLREESGRQTRIRREILDSADVICTTLSGSGSESLKEDLQLDRRCVGPFTCVIVDEACNSTELDILIPLQYMASKLVLVGDPEQLPPTVLSMKAKENLFGRSLFERLDTYFRDQDFRENPVMMLEEQYRMHPEIATFPSQHVNSSRLRSHRSLERRAFPLNKHYAVFDVPFGEETGLERGEIWNPAEANMIGDLCVNLVKVLHPECIGIISPYRNQRSEIQEQLKSRGLSRDNGVKCVIEVDNVDGFQGREKDVIILSYVCAKNYRGFISFVGEKRRLHVALTRARLALYIFGHMETLKEGSEEWRALIENAHKRNCFIRVTSSEDVQSILSTTVRNDTRSHVKDPRLYNKIAPHSKWTNSASRDINRPVHRGNMSENHAVGPALRNQGQFATTASLEEVQTMHSITLRSDRRSPAGDHRFDDKTASRTRWNGTDTLETHRPLHRENTSEDQAVTSTLRKRRHRGDERMSRHRDNFCSSRFRDRSRYRNPRYGDEKFSRLRGHDGSGRRLGHRQDDEKESRSSRRHHYRKGGVLRHKERHENQSSSRQSRYDRRDDTQKHMYRKDSSSQEDKIVSIVDNNTCYLPPNCEKLRRHEVAEYGQSTAEVVTPTSPGLFWPKSSSKTSNNIALTHSQRPLSATSIRSPKRNVVNMTSVGSLITANVIVSTGVSSSPTKPATNSVITGLSSSPSEKTANKATGSCGFSISNVEGIAITGLQRSSTETAANGTLADSVRSLSDLPEATESNGKNPSITMQSTCQSPPKATDTGFSGQSVATRVAVSSKAANPDNQQLTREGNNAPNRSAINDRLEPSAQEAANIVKQRHPPPTPVPIIPAVGPRRRIAHVDSNYTCVSVLRQRASETAIVQNRKDKNVPSPKKLDKKRMCENFRGRKSWN